MKYVDYVAIGGAALAWAVLCVHFIGGFQGFLASAGGGVAIGWLGAKLV